MARVSEKISCPFVWPHQVPRTGAPATASARLGTGPRAPSSTMPWRRTNARAAWEVTLEILPEAPHEANLGKTKRAVSGGADLVVCLRVRRELTTTPGAPPLLRRRHQRSANTETPSLRRNEPSLEVRHAVTAAALGLRANRQLGEADRAPGSILGEEDGERFPRVAGKEPIDLLAVLSFGTLGPKRVT
jgi:hypothetical protein